MRLDTTASSSPTGWPGARPYDVVFYASRGFKAGINITSQYVYDPATLGAGRRFTHCALVGSELTAMEAYPRAVEGPFTGAVHPGGVRFVPVADLCLQTPGRYRDFAVLRCPDLNDDAPGLGAEAMAAGWNLLQHRYGLRRFWGMRHIRLPGEPVAEPGTEWLSCADIVHKVLYASGRFRLKPREVLGPITLFAELSSLGWQDVTAEYALSSFETKQTRYAETKGAAQAAFDIFAVRIAWIVGEMTEAVRARQYRLENLINRQFALGAQGEAFEEPIAMLDEMRASLRDEPALSAESLIADLKSRHGLLK